MSARYWYITEEANDDSGPYMDLNGEYWDYPIVVWDDDEIGVVLGAVGRDARHLMEVDEWDREDMTDDERTRLRHKLGAYMPHEFLLRIEHEVVQACRGAP